MNKNLIGKWYAFYAKNGSAKVYAIYKGNIRTKAGELPRDAVTVWYYPEGYELLDGSVKVSNKINLRDEVLTSCSIEGITFPPKEYLEDNHITEFEILSNGDYMILESTKL